MSSFIKFLWLILFELILLLYLLETDCVFINKGKKTTLI